MNINREQANVYKIISDIIQKLILTIVFVVVFCIVMYYLLTAEPYWSKTIPLGVIESILASTVYKMVGHFYPNKGK